MWENLLFVSHYHNPLLPFTTTLWSCLHFLTFYHSSVLLSSGSAFIAPQKLFQQKSPKFPNCQMQRAFDGVLMWALHSVSTVVAPLSPPPLYSRLFPTSPPTAFLFLYKLFFHQLLEYPSGPGGSKLIPFSSAHIILFHLCEKDCLSPSPFLSSNLFVQPTFPLGIPHIPQIHLCPISYTCFSSPSLLRNHPSYSNANQEPWPNLILLCVFMSAATVNWFSFLSSSQICLLLFLFVFTDIIQVWLFFLNVPAVAQLCSLPVV